MQIPFHSFGLYLILAMIFGSFDFSHTKLLNPIGSSLDIKQIV